jgi:hypothetical protein
MVYAFYDFLKSTDLQLFMKDIEFVVTVVAFQKQWL